MDTQVTRLAQALPRSGTDMDVGCEQVGFFSKQQRHDMEHSFPMQETRFPKKTVSIP